MDVSFGGIFWDSVSHINVSGVKAESYCPAFCEINVSTSDPSGLFGGLLGDYSGHYCSTPAFYLEIHTDQRSPLWSSWYSSSNTIGIYPFSSVSSTTTTSR